MASMASFRVFGAIIFLTILESGRAKGFGDLMHSS